jgi:regulator of sigma E protease
MLGSILIFLLVLSILILVHEFGHYYMAKRAGVWVEEFGIGIPPKLFAKKIGETKYSINLIPFGGFVRLHGEGSEEEVDKPKRAFINKSKKQRIGIIVAGVIMNCILAIASFAVVYLFAGIPKETGHVSVVDVAAGSPAEEVGLRAGDIIEVVNDVEVTSTNEFMFELNKYIGQEVVIDVIGVEEQGATRSVEIFLREFPPEGEGPMGAVVSSAEVDFPPLWKRPFEGIYYGFKEAVFWGVAVINGFVKIFSDLFKGVAPKDIAGPIGIYAITSEVAKVGILALINFIGILSVNLAIFNIIPFPALDGGKLLFIGIESIIGRKVLPKIESFIHMIGMILILIMLFAVTAHDIQRLITFGGISGFIDSVLK